MILLGRLQETVILRIDDIYSIGSRAFVDLTYSFKIGLWKTFQT